MQFQYEFVSKLNEDTIGFKELQEKINTTIENLLEAIRKVLVSNTVACCSICTAGGRLLAVHLD